MPDLVMSDVTRHHITWPNEICAHCKKRDNLVHCPVLGVLYSFQVQTYTGLEVFRCEAYAADETSPFYHLRDADPDEVRLQKLLAQMQMVFGENVVRNLRGNGKTDRQRKRR